MNSKDLRTTLRTGVLRVASASVINKVVAFISNVIVVRMVTQYDYGLFSSANNVISMAMLFTGIGTISGVLQYGAEEREQSEKYQYFKFSAIVGVLFDVLISIAVFLYVAFRFQPIYESGKYIIMLIPSILLHYLFEYFGAILRSRKDVKEYANLLNVNSISFSVLSCICVFYFGITGLCIGRSISYFLGTVMGYYYIKNDIPGIIKAGQLNKCDKKEAIKYSISCCITAALNRVLYVIDIAVISYMVADPKQVAIYRVGTTIPEALEFIPQSILIAVAPHFAQHNGDGDWLRRWTKKLYLYCAGFNAVITILLLLVSSFLIKIFWGDSYIGALTVFNCLSINYFVMATFRQNGTNILSALRETKYNVIVSIITCIFNITLDILLVRRYGINGAAFATVAVVIIASLLSMPYVFYVIYKKKR